MGPEGDLSLLFTSPGPRLNHTDTFTCKGSWEMELLLQLAMDPPKRQGLWSHGKRYWGQLASCTLDILLSLRIFSTILFPASLFSGNPHTHNVFILLSTHI